MGVKIIITEKPSVAREYEKVLKVKSKGKTDGYIEGTCSLLGDIVITWAVGHLVKLGIPKEQNPEWEKWNKAHLPMIPQSYKYLPQSATKKQFNVVKSLYTRKDIDCLYYAGDSGREGIYIQALIRNQIFKTTPKFDEKVVWIDSYTEESIINGIKTAKPYSHYQSMVDSGYMRAISDWLIGMNFTQAFTMAFGNGNTINVGRVMTPTLAMIVQRQTELDNFTKTYFYGIKADDFATWKAVKGSHYFESDDLYNERGFIKKEKALSLISELRQDKKLVVDNVKVEKKTEYAPYLFNLAELQAYCSKHFKISPDNTLKIAQSLYEKKFTTYPRTDARFLSTAVAKELKSKGYDIPSRYVDDSKITDHYAIIPTFHGDANTLNGLDKSVYEAILKRFTDTMLPPYKYDAVSITYIHTNREKFFENFKIVTQYGFKNGMEQKDEEISNKSIPNKGDIVKVNDFVLNELETKPPVPYTTGTLILTMEKAGKFIEDEELREQIKTCGIGTSSTRASIIEKLQEVNFINVDSKQKITPTELGKNAIAIVSEFDEQLISPIKTADMENNLSAIVSGDMKKDDYQNVVTKYVSDLTRKILNNSSGNFVMAEKEVNTSNNSSSNVNDMFSRFKKSNISSSEPQPKQSQNGWGKFVKSSEPQQQKSSPQTNTSTKKHNCPCCGNDLKFGKYGWYCDCKYSFNIEVCGKKMTETDLEDLISKGKTKTYSFKKKAGGTFKASLVLNKAEKKNEFKFSK